MELQEAVELEEKILKPLRWIVGVLQKHQIPFQITGGLAARLYGGQREVADIDLDIPEDRFDELVEELKPYITFGPEMHTDESWKVKLMTLNYEGQDIDLGGAYETQIFDPSKGEWLPSPANLANVSTVQVADLELPVVNREDLIRYKSLLNREVDVQDIRALLGALNLFREED